MPEQKYNARSVRPCRGGGILVEATFGKPCSMQILCRILENRGKCAEKLGVARFLFDDCGITLCRSGRVDVHRVQSIAQAIEVLDAVKTVAQKAFVQIE